MYAFYVTYEIYSEAGLKKSFLIFNFNIITTYLMFPVRYAYIRMADASQNSIYCLIWPRLIQLFLLYHYFLIFLIFFVVFLLAFLISSGLLSNPGCLKETKMIICSVAGPSNPWPVFGPIFQNDLRGVKLFLFVFFLIGASATKSFARARIFKYGLTKDISRKGQKTKAIK